MKSKLVKVLLSCVMSAIIVFAVCSCNKTLENPSQVLVNGKRVELKKGDTLSVNAWGDPEYYFNDKELKKCPSIYKDIKIGDDLDSVLEAFGIKEGYAVVDREIATKEQDGTTEIVSEEYKNNEFFEKENVLDADFCFGFIKKDGSFVLATARELDRKKADLIYNVDFVGSSLADDASVKEKQVISFSVERKK
ncbi:MAG: hypothetical protein MJ080_05815 [Clostridia bacterium]|nr:hypothetical protein [Clostridia bacterium]